MSADREGDAPAGRRVLCGLFDSFNPEEHGVFKALAPGVQALTLYGDTGGGPSGSQPAAALLPYAAGASVAAHLHPGYEHILILEGSQRDHLGRYARGTLVISPPGSRHAVTSDEGCLALAIWNQPVQFIEE